MVKDNELTIELDRVYVRARQHAGESMAHL